MNSNVAIEAMVSKREQILAEQRKMNERYNSKIESLDAAIELLTGKKANEVADETHYDDEHPDYIKSSQEEI